MFTLRELIYLVILIGAVGYVFSGFIRAPRPYYEYFYRRRFFDLEDFKFACIVTAPAILFHELAHKFVAMSFGIPAYFEIYWTGIFIAVFLKLIRSPILIVAPGYVVLPFVSSHFQDMLISIAGPLTNLLLYFISSMLLKYKKNLKRNVAIGLALSKKINLILFIFNMLPIPPLDGYHVFYDLFKIIF